MPAYWIGHVTISDPTAYEAYRQANAVAFTKYGARFLVRGGAQEVVEGSIRPRTVVIEFPDLKAAQDCYHSPEYQAAKAKRVTADAEAYATNVIAGAIAENGLEAAQFQVALKQVEALQAVALRSVALSTFSG